MTALQLVLALATLIGGAAGLWFLRDKARRRRLAPNRLDPQASLALEMLERSQPRLFELLPYFFEVFPGAKVPYVEVTFYVVNHHKKRRLLVERLVVTNLSLSGGPSLGTIEQRGPPRSVTAGNTELVFCTKELSDGGARELSIMRDTDWTIGSLSAYAEVSGLRRNKRSRVTIIAQQIVGHVRGPTEGQSDPVVV